MVGKDFERGKGCREREELKKIIKKFPANTDNLIPALHELQERFGFIPQAAREELTRFFGLSAEHVLREIEFYSHFTLKPRGKLHIKFCNGTACFVKGASKVLTALEKEIKIKAGETSSDGLFSIESVRCLGACGLGPVLKINDELYTELKPEKIPGIIRALKEKED